MLEAAWRAVVEGITVSLTADTAGSTVRLKADTTGGSRLVIEAITTDTLQAYVQVFADDVAARRTRQARVIVPKPAPGIAIEIYPEEVSVAWK